MRSLNARVSAEYGKSTDEGNGTDEGYLFLSGARETLEAGEAGEQPIQFLHERTTEKGLQQWNTLPGQMCSSTRAEIAAVGAALMKPVPIHIGIDNKGALSNATKLINIAQEWEKRFHGNPTWSPPRYPIGKAWGLLPDGDMLQTVWRGIQTRGPASQRLSKVKGHATVEDVANGIATSEDRTGNNESDACATLGIREATPGAIRRIICWLTKRHTLYGLWMNKTDRMIVAVLKAEKEQREVRTKAEKLLLGVDGVNTAMINCTINVDPSSTEEVGLLEGILPFLPNSFADTFTNSLAADVHAFIAKMKWKKWSPGTRRCGATWIEMLAAFDVQGHRSQNSIQRSDDKAHQRFLQRSSKAKRVGGQSTPAPPTHAACSRPSLALELQSFKAAFRKVVKHFVPTVHHYLFQQSVIQSDKRLREFGIGVHSPSINGIVDTDCFSEGNVLVELALLRQRKATAAKRLKGMLQLNATNNAIKEEHGHKHPLEAIKATITQLDLNGPSRWNRKIRRNTNFDGEPLEAQQPATSRNLTCIACLGQIDAKHMKLEVKDGHRVLQCHHCPWRGRATLLDCECGNKWFQCVIHRIDPTTHRSRRPPTSLKAKTNTLDEVKFSDRKAPLVRNNDLSEAIHRAKRPKKNLHKHAQEVSRPSQAHVKFITDEWNKRKLVRKERDDAKLESCKVR